MSVMNSTLLPAEDIDEISESLQSTSIDLSLPTKPKISDKSKANERRITKSNLPRPSVFLTVSSSSIDGALETRHFELNWHNVPEEIVNDDKSEVGLFDHDPSNQNFTSLSLIKVKNYPEGYYRTNVEFTRLQIEENELSDEFLPFWIAFIYDQKVLVASCLRFRPRWMEQLQEEIGDKRLNQVMIPGTHDSGCYLVTPSSMFHRLIHTQELDIWNQLVYGIRYLDLRVEYAEIENKADKFWITHFFRVDVRLVDILHQVKKFMNATTKEVVILDFHSVEKGFNHERHAELVSILIQELGEFMHPRMEGPLKTFKEMWESGKRLFVGYAYSGRNSLSPLLNKEVEHLWANTDDVSKLEEYFEENICEQNYLYSAMAELTIQPEHFKFDEFFVPLQGKQKESTAGGLREMAQCVNSKVTKWFRDIWSQRTNIVATDFFLGNDIINVAISTNKN